VAGSERPRPVRRMLDHERDAQPPEATVRAQSLVLRTKVAPPDRPLEQIEHAHVVPALEHKPGRRLVWELPDEVAPPDLERVEPGAPRELVHHSLDREAGNHPPDTAVRAHRCLVGHYRVDAARE